MNIEISLVVRGILAVSMSARSVCAMGNIPSLVSWRVIRICRDYEDLLGAVVATFGRAPLARQVVEIQCLTTWSNPLRVGEFWVITVFG